MASADSRRLSPRCQPSCSSAYAAIIFSELQTDLDPYLRLHDVRNLMMKEEERLDIQTLNPKHHLSLA